MRTTPYKEKILHLLEKEHLLSIADIQAALPKEVDYSTIFRNVEKLLQEGKIKKVIVDKKTIKYEQEEHIHDHFICTDCKKVQSIKLPKTSTFLPKNTKLTDVVMRGLCSECNS